MPLPNTMSFTPFDPLAAAELNDMVENDDALQDWTAFDAGTLPVTLLDSTATGDAFLEIGRTTLGSTADTMSVSSLPARKYLRVYISIVTSGATNLKIRYNGDTGANYSTRVSTDFNTGGTAVSGNEHGLVSTAVAQTKFAVLDIVNISALEKYVSATCIESGGAGASNAPGTREGFMKWANTSAQISSITVFNDGAGDYLAGTEIVVLGKD